MIRLQGSLITLVVFLVSLPLPAVTLNIVAMFEAVREFNQ